MLLTWDPQSVGEMDQAASATEYNRVPSLDATIQRFVQELAAQGRPPLHTLSPEEAHAVLAGLQTGQGLRVDADSEDCTISAGPTGEIPLRIVRPPGTPGPLATVVYFHGGGWVLGDRETHDRLVREIAVAANVTVVFVDYARSPGAHYPVAIQQAYAATRWVAENGESIKVDPSRLVLMGDGVGGNMVAAVTLLAKERGDPQSVSRFCFTRSPTQIRHPVLPAVRGGTMG
jgi:acetyl esterase